MKLIHKSTGLEVQVNDIVFDFRGESAIVTGWMEPQSPASTGRIHVNLPSNTPFSCYPEVYSCEWIDREDREEILQPASEGGIKSQPLSVVRTADQTTIKQISEMQRSLARYQDDLDKIEALINGYVDGSRDCSEASCLANKIMQVIHPEG